MAKKKKDGERASFLFDDDAGRGEETIDLFGPDEDNTEEPEEPDGAEQPEKEPDEPTPSGEKAAPNKARA